VSVKSTRRLTAREVEALVVHPGGKLSTEEHFPRADFGPGRRVLDVGTTAIEAGANRCAVS
jgi:hypothetical protein